MPFGDIHSYDVGLLQGDIGDDESENPTVIRR